MTFDFPWPAEDVFVAFTLSLVHHVQTHTVTFSGIKHSIGDDESAALATNVNFLQIIERMVKVQLRYRQCEYRGSRDSKPAFWVKLYLYAYSRKMRLPSLVPQDYDLKNYKKRTIDS